MINLTPTQVTPTLMTLFDQPMPAGMRCAGVLDGVIAGQIVTDSAEQPTWGIVRETDFGTTYFAGTPDALRSAQFIHDTQRTGDVFVGVWPDDALAPLLPTDMQYDGIAVDYTDRPLHQGLDAYLQVPDGCTIQRVDATLLKRSVDSAGYLASYGSAEKALESLIGFYLMHGDDILSEAFAGPTVRGVREMGVVTLEAHRQQGYASVVCAHLVQACEQSGAATYWNCAQQNLASNALARKLGYRKAQAYRVLAWFKQ